MHRARRQLVVGQWGFTSAPIRTGFTIVMSDGHPGIYPERSSTAQRMRRHSLLSRIAVIRNGVLSQRSEYSAISFLATV